MMYCRLFAGYTNDAGCNQCDINAGYAVGSWRETCYRDKHHPVLSGLRWWLKPKSFKFKLYIFMRWITRRLPLVRHWTIWFDRRGLHLGTYSTNLSWLEPQSLAKP